MGSLAGFEHLYIDKQSPRTLLLLHGTGGDENDLVPLGEKLDPGANILSPRGQVSENGQSRFFRRLAEGVFDREDLSRRSGGLAEFIRAAAERYGFASDTLTAVGYSNGANIALYLCCSRPSLLKQAVLFRPLAAALPEELPELGSLRLLTLSGLFDPLAGPAEAEGLEKILREKGADLKAVKLPAGHGLSAQDVEEARDFLRLSVL